VSACRTVDAVIVATSDRDDDDTLAKVAEKAGYDQGLGTVITLVQPGDAADKAGIQTNDILIAVNGERTPSVDVTRSLIGNREPGGEKLDHVDLADDAPDLLVFDHDRYILLIKHPLHPGERIIQRHLTLQGFRGLQHGVLRRACPGNQRLQQIGLVNHED